MMDQHPIVVIACKVFQDLLEHFLPPDLADQVTFLDYGLHEFPKKLTKAVQEQIDGIQEPSRILLGYGLCGNGLNGIQAGKHTLLIPRADDCIAIFLGSYQAYLKEFNDNPGTYYLTKGWLESGSDPLKQYHQTVEKYGAETGEWIMDQQYMNYRRLVLVAHTQEDLEIYRPRAQEVAEYCGRWGMKYEEVLGSDAYIRNLVEAVNTLSDSNEEFLVISPGGIIRQNHFFRIPA
ncbi:MAG: DUF1638 domain-containing protein [Candidatus Promineifilaceae bacterium]